MQPIPVEGFVNVVMSTYFSGWFVHIPCTTYLVDVKVKYRFSRQSSNSMEMSWNLIHPFLLHVKWNSFSKCFAAIKVLQYHVSRVVNVYFDEPR